MNPVYDQILNVHAVITVLSDTISKKISLDMSHIPGGTLEEYLLRFWSTVGYLLHIKVSILSQTYSVKIFLCKVNKTKTKESSCHRSY